MLRIDKRNRCLYLLLALAVSLNIGLWFHSNKIYIKWANVPPVPGKISASMGFLGDNALAFRVSGLALQNYGSIGGDQNLDNYNYKTLGEWFELMDSLDSHSFFVPYIAAYYYGAVRDGSKLQPVISYLEKVGLEPGAHNWRWLVQAAYLAQHRLHDSNEALRLAKELGSIYKPGMPIWTRNLQSMLLVNMGDEQAAYYLMLQILKSDAATMSASEYNSNIRLLCDAILTKPEAAKNPLCHNN